MTLRVAGQQFTSIAAVRASETCGCVNESEPTDIALGLLIDEASDVLAILSGGVVGRTTFTVRPCGDGYCSACPCCGLDGIPLPGEYPVVTSVKIDGATVDPATYALHETRIGWNLVRISTTGTQLDPWPQWQSLWRPTTQVDTFEVVYVSGIFVGWVIEQAAIELVCDFATAEERKPNNIRGAGSVTQGGVTISLQERAERIKDGSSGPATSRFLGVYAPDGRSRSMVYAPELDAGWQLHVVR